MVMQKKILVWVGFAILLLGSCRSSSGKKPGEQPPPTPPPAEELTEEVCQKKVDDTASRQQLVNSETVPTPLKSTSFLVALAVSSGRLDAKCLEFSYDEALPANE